MNSPKPTNAASRESEPGTKLPTRPLEPAEDSRGQVTTELLLAVASAAALGEGLLTVTHRHVKEAEETLREAMENPELRDLAEELAKNLAADWPKASESYTEKECMELLKIRDRRTWESLLKRVPFLPGFDPKTEGISSGMLARLRDAQKWHRTTRNRRNAGKPRRV